MQLKWRDGWSSNLVEQWLNSEEANELLSPSQEWSLGEHLLDVPGTVLGALNL